MWQAPPIDFAIHPPSTSWESVSLGGDVPAVVWLWFKPPHAPLDLVVRIPQATRDLLADRMTFRQLFEALRIDCRQLALWICAGYSFDSHGGQAPAFEQTLEHIAPGQELDLHLRMHVGWPVQPPPLAASLPPQAMASEAQFQATHPAISWNPGGMTGARSPLPASSASTDALFAAIDADWQSILQIERLSFGLRKQLGTLLSRLQSLNRDLSPEEHRASDNQDRKDWQDARRWLRDCASNVSRFIREHDIGATSNAGNRQRFEQFYEQHVVPRRPVEGLSVIQQEFESYRKTVQSLMLGMQSVLSNAGRDGEQRAQRLLGMIAQKARRSRSRKEP